jgi:hypothetical protein
MGQPPGLSRRRCMGQPLVADSTEHIYVPQEVYQSLRFVPAALAEAEGDRPFVVVVRSRVELNRWLGEPLRGPEWIQVEGLLGDPDAWAPAAPGASHVPLDVVISDPASEFSDLYRLVDICAVRDVRVSIPAAPGFLKAVKLAASLRLPVRILPGQPSPEVLAELTEALEFYLHGPMVEMPVEFFHSLLATVSGADRGSLWMILEEDPAAFLHYGTEGRPELPRRGDFRLVEVSPEAFVEHQLSGLVERGAECATCPWQQVCRGYFKWPDPAYSCGGVKQLFSIVEAAAAEIERDLVISEEQLHMAGRDKP